MATSSVSTEQLPPKKDGFIGKRVRFLVDVFIWLLISLFISILIEWCGIFLGWWDTTGSSHATEVLNNELQWLNNDFHSVLGSPVETSLRFSAYMYQFFFVWFNYDLLASLMEIDALHRVTAYIKAAVTVIQLFFVRLTIIGFSLPVFIVFIICSLVDGLMVRELRRFGGDRESAFVWHNAASWIKPLTITPFIFYLTSPWSIHPNWIVLPFVILLSISMWLVSSKFKKYA